MTFYPTFTRLVPCGLLAGLALALAIPAHAQQTNDPLVGQQQYLFDVHKVDEAWAVTTGSSNTLIAVHSVLGFRGTHNDPAGARFRRAVPLSARSSGSPQRWLEQRRPTPIMESA